MASNGKEADEIIQFPSQVRDETWSVLVRRLDNLTDEQIAITSLTVSILSLATSLVMLWMVMSARDAANTTEPMPQHTTTERK